MNNQQKTGGVSIITVITIVLVILKLTGNIDWTWWAVFAPMIISTSLLIFIIIILSIIVTLRKSK